MNKSKLIELLEQIPGDPDIMVWNGFVQDFMDLGKVVESELFKLSWAMYLLGCERDIKRDMKDPDYRLTDDDIKELRKSYKKYVNWETNCYVTLKQVEEGIYNCKKIWALEAKSSGKKYWDRNGTIEY